MTKISKLELCKLTRSYAAESLYEVLKDVLTDPSPVSEVAFRDNWLEKLRRHPNIFPNGWYEPPPHGIGVLFATDDNPNRASPKSIRPQEYWPKEESFLDKSKGILFLYVSPIAKKEGIIGDFGLTVYLGKDQSIINHLKNAYLTVLQVFKKINVGMSFADIAKIAKELLAEKGMYSNLLSPSDPTGTNIGHTIPGSYEDFSPKEQRLIQSAPAQWSQLKDMIRTKRIFINEAETFTVTPNMAFTLEPRPEINNSASLPTVWFHTLVLIDKNGNKQLVTNFAKIFSIANMDYLEEIKP